MKIGLDLKKLSRIPRKFKVIVGLALCLFVFGLLFMNFLYPQIEEKKRLEQDYRAAIQELDKLTAIKNNIEKTRQEYAALQDNLQKVLTQMPEQKDIPNLLRQVSQIGQETKLRIKSFTPREAAAKDFYLEVPFELKYSGGYHSMGYFLDGIRRLDRIIHVTSFTLEGKGAPPKTMLEGTCTAKTYVYSKEPAKEKPAPAATEKKDAKNEPVVKK